MSPKKLVCITSDRMAVQDGGRVPDHFATPRHGRLLLGPDSMTHVSERKETKMHILRNEAEQDFLSLFAGERQRLIHTGETLLASGGSALKTDTLGSLGVAFLKAMELMKAAEDRITESQRILEQTRADRSRYQFLFDRAPTALLITSSDTTIWSANRAAGALFGREVSQLVGRDITGMVDIEHLRWFRESLAQVVTSGDAGRWSFRLRPAGKTSFIATAGVRLIDDPMSAHRNLYWSLASS